MTFNTPRVSILIPCYNARSRVGRAIESALRETYPNKEVIVVDDGSTDGSVDVIRSFGDRIRWETLPHKGANAARNRLLELSAGEWLQYLDADDYLLPEKIEDQVNFLKAVGKTDVVYSPILLEADGKRRLIEMPGRSDFVLNFINWGCIQTGGLLIKRSAILEVGRWREAQPCCQEHELLLRFIEAKRKFSYCDKAGAVYRYWNPLSVGRGNPKLIVSEIVKILDEIKSYLISRDLWKPSYAKAFFRKKFECARLIYERDPVFATEIVGRINKENKNFFPEGAAAPFLYRLCYRAFGFSGTERIARFIRRFK